MLVSRPPKLFLRPFIKSIWASDETNRGQLADADRERMLPTGGMRLVFRLSDDPLRVFRDGDDVIGAAVGRLIIGGPRTAYYDRDISKPTRSVGLQLHPGAATILFGVPSCELAGQHTCLEEIWGREAFAIRDRLGEADSPEKQLEVLETILAERLPNTHELHPAVSYALKRFTETTDVNEVVTATGYSHRRFIEVFRQTVGLPPKPYCRVVRFHTVLQCIGSDFSVPLVDLALASGYADQAHLTREFREFSGISPLEYKRLAPNWVHHVPIPRDAAGKGQFYSRQYLRDKVQWKDK